MSGIQVKLAEQEKWEVFYPNTEMIVTKSKGRVIFPHLKYLVSGLSAAAFYTIHLHLERTDDKKYKFEGGWTEASKGDPPLPIQYKEHPEGARTGDHWMSGPVSFSTLKLTNDPNNKDEKCIVVQSLHKYLPVLTITQVGAPRGEQFRLHLTEFIAVTCYQNEEIIRLKVKHNKYASGFRATGKRRAGSDSPAAPDAKRDSPSSSSGSSAGGSPVLQTQQPMQMQFQPDFQPHFQMMHSNQMQFNALPYQSWYGYPMNAMPFGSDWNSAGNKENAWNHTDFNQFHNL